MRRVGGWGATLIAAPSWSWQWYVCLSVTVAVPACACMTSFLRCSACVSYANTRVWRNKQAQANSAGCLLFMGAAAQALKMARHAVASLERSMPLTGRGKSTGMAWEAHGQVDQGLRAILHAAQVAHSPGFARKRTRMCVSLSVLLARLLAKVLSLCMHHLFEPECTHPSASGHRRVHMCAYMDT